MQLTALRLGVSLRFLRWGWPLVACACVALLLSANALAEGKGATITSAKLESTEDGYEVDADIQLALSATLQEAVRKGVPLYFVVEFELQRGRWYWLDQTVIAASRERRISYAPLTDQYRISFSGSSQNVTSFEDVRRALSRVRSWAVIEKGKLKSGEKYDAALRFRLDTSQLPKPFQLNVIASNEWSVTSDWYRWTFTAPGEVRP
ncbi:MAG: DUF4390 domain-containing protein [Burkholderiales bacterium]|nr:DUF4390 domain-containing protein [Burkholderiales bacterium]